MLAFGAFEHTVSLWNLRTFSHFRTLATTFDTSLALNDDASVLYTTAWRWKGVAAYCTANGAELWRRTDLGGRTIRISKDEQLLYCFGEKSCETLNRSTGKSKKLFRGVRDLWECPSNDVLFLEKKPGFNILHAQAQTARKVQRCSFGTLDVAFSPDRVFVSESGGPLRCFDLQTGKEIWRNDPPRDEHYLRIAFSETDERLFAARWRYSQGGPYQIFGFNPKNGDFQHVADVESDGELLFCLDGTALVTLKGRVYDVASGKLVATLPFSDHLGGRAGHPHWSANKKDATVKT